MSRFRATPVPPPTQLLTYAEAGQQLGVHQRTVRAWADEGRLVKIRLGPQSLRVTAASVEEFITQSVSP